MILDLRDLVSFADFFVICSGTSKVQVQAIADGIREALKQEDRRPLHTEGYGRADWILLDYGALVVHVFRKEARDFYDLERLWRDAESVEVPKKTRASRRLAGSRSKPTVG